MTTKLVRKPLQIETSDVDAEFARDVRSYLGHKINTDISYLKKVLIDLQIDPFDPLAVARYKRDKVRSELFNRWQKFSAWFGCMIICSGALTLLLGEPWEFGAAAFSLGLLIEMIVFVPAGGQFRRIVGWRRERLDHYSGLIPEFVLQTALDIKKKNVLCDLWVDRLYVTDINVFDPFLIVTNGSEEYYIEVWDEPKFKQQRMV